MGLFLIGKVAAKFYQLRNPLGGLVPRKAHTRVGVGNTSAADGNALAVVCFIKPAAPAIFYFEKFGMFTLR